MRVGAKQMQLIQTEGSDLSEGAKGLKAKARWRSILYSKVPFAKSSSLTNCFDTRALVNIVFRVDSPAQSSNLRQHPSSGFVEHHPSLMITEPFRSVPCACMSCYQPWALLFKIAQARLSRTLLDWIGIPSIVFQRACKCQGLFPLPAF